LKIGLEKAASYADFYKQLSTSLTVQSVPG